MQKAPCSLRRVYSNCDETRTRQLTPQPHSMAGDKGRPTTFDGCEAVSAQQCEGHCRELTVRPGQAASVRPLQRSQDRFCSMWYDVTTMEGSCSMPCTLKRSRLGHDRKRATGVLGKAIVDKQGW
jgi:hypothetical protein